MKAVGPAGSRRVARDGPGRHQRQESRAENIADRHPAQQCARLIAENAKDVAAAKANGLDAASVDRLTLTEKTVTSHGRRPAPDRRPARPHRRDQRHEVPPIRHPGRQDARAARRDRHHLRIAPERDGGCRRAVPEIGQRGDPARRLGSDPFQPGHRRLRARRACAPPACRRPRCRWSTPPTAPPWAS